MSVLVSLAEHLVDLELRAVVEVDDDLVGALDDVIVGDDEAFLAVDDEAGAERGHLAVGPERAVTLLSKKSSKNSSNGEPFGTLGSGTPCGPLTVWLVEMLTTASISFSATRRDRLRAPRLRLAQARATSNGRRERARHTRPAPKASAARGAGRGRQFAMHRSRLSRQAGAAARQHRAPGLVTPQCRMTAAVDGKCDGNAGGCQRGSARRSAAASSRG